jgi:hypothetical protein
MANADVSSGDFKLGNVFIFLLPILGLVKFNFFGELYLHEVILVLACGIVVIGGLGTRKPSIFWFILFFGLLWLVSQIVTDYYMGIPLEDYLRGWAKISFFLISYVALSNFISTDWRAFVWIFVSAIPLFFRPFQLFYMDLDPLVLWKFGVGPALLIFTSLPFFLKYRNNSDSGRYCYWIAFVYFVFGVISFLLNARSFAGLSMVSALIAYAYPNIKGSVLSVQRISFVLIFLSMFSLGILKIYSVGASSGIFGAEAQLKYEAQMLYGNGVVDIIVGGRAEGLVSTIAIYDSPFLGHGSWAKDFKYLELFLELRSFYSEVVHDAIPEEFSDGLIPSHSYLLGAWVEAGFCGALFWAFVIFITVFKVLPAAIARADWFGLAVLCGVPTFIWAIIFSPFGSNVRVDVAGLLAIYTYLLNRQKS